MKDATPKEQIMSKIRNALIEKTENPYQDNEIMLDVIKVSDPDEEPEVLFAQELIAVGGNFIYCENEHSFLDNLGELMQDRGWKSIWCQNDRITQLLRTAELPHFKEVENSEDALVGITGCEKLISRTGSILVSDSEISSRSAFSYPDIHLVVAYNSQVTATIKSALASIKLKYNGTLPTQLTFVTGPSRTADIEKTLVKGAHGPKELYVFLIDDF